MPPFSVAVRWRQELRHDKEYRRQKTFGRVIEEGVLTVVRIVTGIDNRLGEDLGVFLCFGA